MSRTTKHRIPGTTCPHCDHSATVRFGRQLSALVREVTYRCENDACGHGFVVQLSVIRTTIPSAAPNPEVHLPFAPQRRALVPANDDRPIERPPAVNDDAGAMTG